MKKVEYSNTPDVLQVILWSDGPMGIISRLCIELHLTSNPRKVIVIQWCTFACLIGNKLWSQSREITMDLTARNRPKRRKPSYLAI